ncbi:MAG: sulfotransferase domain-containing protein [Acidimicrobiales bacterium]
MRAQRSRALSWAERQWWTLHRFGLTPARLPRRVANRAEPRVLCTSIPKAGTHLLERALCLHPHLYRALRPTLHAFNLPEPGGLSGVLASARPGQIVVGHLPYRPEWSEAVVETATRVLVMVRDPRDVVVSEAHYVVTDPSHPWYRQYAQLPDVASRIRLTITGDAADGVPSITDLLSGYVQWERHGGLVVRFEDLVGLAGGGDSAHQRSALAGVFEHLGLPASDAFLDRLQRQLFSARSPTFRRGAIGQWREAFDDGSRVLFAEHAGQLLGDLGYAP